VYEVASFSWRAPNQKPHRSQVNSLLIVASAPPQALAHVDIPLGVMVLARWGKRKKPGSTAK
jgi:hypothetical protein